MDPIVGVVYRWIIVLIVTMVTSLTQLMPVRNVPPIVSSVIPSTNAIYAHQHITSTHQLHCARDVPRTVFHACSTPNINFYAHNVW